MWESSEGARAVFILKPCLFNQPIPRACRRAISHTATSSMLQCWSVNPTKVTKGFSFVTRKALKYIHLPVLHKPGPFPQCPNPMWDSEQCRHPRRCQNNPYKKILPQIWISSRSCCWIKAARHVIAAFVSVLNLPRPDLADHSFGSRMTSQYLCNITD